MVKFCMWTSRQPKPPKKLTPLPKAAYVITIAVNKYLLLDSASVHPAALADMIYEKDMYGKDIGCTYRVHPKGSTYLLRSVISFIYVSRIILLVTV